MDVIDRRVLMGRVLAQMAGNKIPGIKYTSFVVENAAWYSNEVQIPIDEKPYGFMIAAESEIGANYVSKTLIRFGAMWTEYNGGQYRPTSCCAANSSGVQDFYNLSNTQFPTYDSQSKILTVKSAGAYFTKQTYHVWYFTIPF